MNGCCNITNFWSIFCVCKFWNLCLAGPCVHVIWLISSSLSLFPPRQFLINTTFYYLFTAGIVSVHWQPVGKWTSGTQRRAPQPKHVWQWAQIATWLDRRRPLEKNKYIEEWLWHSGCKPFWLPKMIFITLASVGSVVACRVFMIEVQTFSEN